MPTIWTKSQRILKNRYIFTRTQTFRPVRRRSQQNTHVRKQTQKYQNVHANLLGISDESGGGESERAVSCDSDRWSPSGRSTWWEPASRLTTGVSASLWPCVLKLHRPLMTFLPGCLVMTWDRQPNFSKIHWSRSFSTFGTQPEPDFKGSVSLPYLVRWFLEQKMTFQNVSIN